MKPEIDDNNALVCPSCGNSSLHHGKFEGFVRDQEDAETGKRIIVDKNGWVDTSKNLKGNPSPRRNAVLIHFICECCSMKSVLAVYQHKGSTYVEQGLATESIIYDVGQ